MSVKIHIQVKQKDLGTHCKEKQNFFILILEIKRLRKPMLIKLLKFNSIINI